MQTFEFSLLYNAPKFEMYSYYKSLNSRYQRVFQKKSCRWSVTPCKIPKEYQYIPQLMQRILVKRLNDNIGMNQILALEVDDPRRLSAHLAPIPPPPTCQIVNEQKSRFKSTDDMDKTIDYWMEWNITISKPLLLLNFYYAIHVWLFHC